MTEYERERDQCPMHFDDGENPWTQTESYVKIFDWLIYRNSAVSIPACSCIALVIYTFVAKILVQ